MSKNKVSKDTRISEKKKRTEWPVVVYLWAFGLAIFGYTLSNLGLSHLPHSYHWVTGIIGGLAGIIIGWAWYRWQGDVI
jgi:hypothetical protein